MSLEIRYHALAAAEVVRAAAWYENEAAELGDRFLAAIEAAVARSSRWPNAGTPVVIAADGAVLCQSGGDHAQLVVPLTGWLRRHDLIPQPQALRAASR